MKCSEWIGAGGVFGINAVSLENQEYHLDFYFEKYEKEENHQADF